MRTNIIAIITFTLVTNWTLLWIESGPMNPYPKQPSMDDYRNGYHERGIILSNTTANIAWGTNNFTLLLESTKIAETNRLEWR